MTKAYKKAVLNQQYKMYENTVEHHIYQDSAWHVGKPVEGVADDNFRSMLGTTRPTKLNNRTVHEEQYGDKNRYQYSKEEMPVIKSIRHHQCEMQHNRTQKTHITD